MVCTAAPAGGCTGVGCGWVVPGGVVYRVLPHRGRVRTPPSRPAASCGFPGECLGGSSVVSAAGFARGGGVRRVQQGPGVPPDAQNTPQDQYRRDSRRFILKLVNNPECHHYLLMRPGILPISKTGPKFTTLNSWDFHIGQPSLCRNKWSRI